MIGLLCGACLPLQVGCGRQGKAELGAKADCNVVLISIDTLRRDHLDLYGYDRPTSPHLDELAKEAVVFDEAVNVGGATLPIHMSMLTSLHPLVHRVTPYTGQSLAEERVTLAESLKAQGYDTAAFTDGGWVRAKYGFDQGFDLYDDKGWHFVETLPKARRWLGAHGTHRFFLFLHTYDVHSGKKKLPYDSPEERYNLRYTRDGYGGFDGCIEDLCASRLLVSLNTRILQNGLDPHTVFSQDELQHMIDLYDGSINYVDDELSGFFQFLRESGIYDNTLVIVTADHGEEFLDHGLFLHHEGVYGEIARVPLIIKFPGAAFGGVRFSGLVSSVDLMPTVLDVLGLQPPPASDGLSVVPQLRAGAHARKYEVIASALRSKAQPPPPASDGHDVLPCPPSGARAAEYELMASAIRTEDWKLVVSKRELFDLRADPRERDNVIADHPEVAKRLQEIWEHRVNELMAEGDALDVHDQRADVATLSPAERETLRSLGYLN